MSRNFERIEQASDEDLLFMERLDIFLEKSLDDMRDFARREGREFEQIRVKAAEWHSKYLFDQRQTSASASAATDAKGKVHEVTRSVSTLLETLLHVAGHHSLVLVVDPADTEDDGFLGGSITGREYWRGLRHGGSSGARNFKEYCKASIRTETSPQESRRPETIVAGSRPTPAVAMKNNLYAEIRSRLRAISGVRNAEMKWTKPGKLSVYGVALMGWPTEIEHRNPSKMSFQETSTIMRLLQEDVIRFRSLRDDPDGRTFDASQITEATEDMSWAFNADVVNPRGSYVEDTASSRFRSGKKD